MSRPCLLPTLSALFPSLLKLLISLSPNLLTASRHSINRSNVAYGAMEPLMIVVANILGHDTPRVLNSARSRRAHRILLERPVEPLQFTVGLRIIGRGPHMRHPHFPNEDLKLLSNKLRAISYAAFCGTLMSMCQC